MEKLLLFSFCDEETDVKHVDEANFLILNLNEYNIIDLPVLIHRFTTSVQFGKLDGFIIERSVEQNKLISWLQEATSKTWTQNLVPDPEKPGPWKTWTQKKLDPEKSGT